MLLPLKGIMKESLSGSMKDTHPNGSKQEGPSIEAGTITVPIGVFFMDEEYSRFTDVLTTT
jgi:hypothetical protein